MKINLEDLTTGQREGVKRIKDFLEAPINPNDYNTRVIVLTGQAGTGKTTMLRVALEDIISNESSLSAEAVKNKYEADLFTNGILGAVGVAVSHKAKKVLNKSIPITTTYASYFGLVPSYDEFGNQKFIENSNPKVIENSLFKKKHKVAVHDEVSMYDMEMIRRVLSNTDIETKIILVGDPGQMPPINQEDLDNGLAVSDDDSPAFSIFSNVIHLSEKVRQTKGNPIIELTDTIYQEIFSTKDLNKILTLMAQPVFKDEVGYQMLEYKNFIKQYTSVTTDFRDSKILAYRNDTVDTFNNTVRNYILKNPLHNIISGELIYMKDTFAPDRNTKFYNSDEYVITKSEVVVYEDIECYQAWVNREDYYELMKSQRPFLFIPTENGQRMISQKEIFFNRMIQDSKSYGQKMGNIGKKMDYLKKFAKVSYGYCYTIHRCQGSTYKNMFIDVNDILSLNISNKRKLQAIYTAITRASHSVYFLHN